MIVSSVIAVAPCTFVGRSGAGVTPGPVYQAVRALPHRASSSSVALSDGAITLTALILPFQPSGETFKNAPPSKYTALQRHRT